MPKYFCDYCDTYLTHDSPSVRKTHCSGRKHKENVRMYYQKWLEDQVQKLVDDTKMVGALEDQVQMLIDNTTAAYKQGKIPNNPFQGAAAPGGAMIPPPANMGPGKGPMPGVPGPGGPGGPMPGGPRPAGPGPMRMMGPGGPMAPMGMRGPGGPMRPMGGPGPMRPMMMGGPGPMRPMMGGPGPRGP